MLQLLITWLFGYCFTVQGQPLIMLEDTQTWHLQNSSSIALQKQNDFHVSYFQTCFQILAPACTQGWCLVTEIILVWFLGLLVKDWMFLLHMRKYGIDYYFCSLFFFAANLGHRIFWPRLVFLCEDCFMYVHSMDENMMLFCNGIVHTVASYFSGWFPTLYCTRTGVSWPLSTLVLSW